jgi:DNA-binding Lrp family transcriptional regulator
MAVGAYILIQTDLGHAAAVAAEVGGLPAVSSADTVAGPYDVIARVDVDTIDALGHFVVSQVQAIDGVTRTLSCPIVAL